MRAIKVGKNSRLRVLGTTGLAAGFAASSHFGMVLVEEKRFENPKYADATKMVLIADVA
jgi:hypothetical protein